MPARLAGASPAPKDCLFHDENRAATVASVLRVDTAIYFGRFS